MHSNVIFKIDWLFWWQQFRWCFSLFCFLFGSVFFCFLFFLVVLVGNFQYRVLKRKKNLTLIWPIHRWTTPLSKSRRRSAVTWRENLLRINSYLRASFSSSEWHTSSDWSHHSHQPPSAAISRHQPPSACPGPSRPLPQKDVPFLAPRDSLSILTE